MLGWMFIVETFEREKIAWWEDTSWYADKWLNDAVKLGNANIIQQTGGYPDTYEVRTEVLPKDKVMNQPDIEWCLVEKWDLS